MLVRGETDEHENDKRKGIVDELAEVGWLLAGRLAR